jgi:hypothetical protein
VVLNSLVLSPYNVVEEEAGVFSFVISQDITFHLSFQLANNNDGFEGLPLVQDKVLIVNFRPVPKVEVDDISDARIAKTITNHLQAALDNGYILNYLCSDEKGLERHRRIIFGKWYRALENKDEYEKIDYVLEEDDINKKTYLGFVIKIDNDLFDEFQASVEGEVAKYQDDK